MIGTRSGALALGLYRIRTVSEMTGISTATLRAWERRYGVPTPSRTASSYRLYTDQDVAMIVRMRDLVKAGTAPAEASRTFGMERLEQTSSTADTQATPFAELDRFVAATDAIIQATKHFDISALETAIGKALALGPAVSVYERTISPALVQIGNLWHDGEITVAQEHLVSNKLVDVLMKLVRLSQPADGSRSVVLACFAEETHVLGLYGAALRLASWGYRSLMLGAVTPPSAIARAVEALKPDLVGLGVTTSLSAACARELVDAYADACGTTPWLVGGEASESMRARIEARGGVCVGRDLVGARALIERATASSGRERVS